MVSSKWDQEVTMTEETLNLKKKSRVTFSKTKSTSIK
jgi:hypothetical protein